MKHIRRDDGLKGVGCVASHVFLAAPLAAEHVHDEAPTGLQVRHSEHRRHVRRVMEQPASVVADPAVADVTTITTVLGSENGEKNVR